MKLKDYIKGNRKGKGANRLERQAMNDPFLQDALEGFEAVPDNHIPIIEYLEKKFAFKWNNDSKYRKISFYLSAATILFIIGFGTYFYLEITRLNKLEKEIYAKSSSFEYKEKRKENTYKKTVKRDDGTLVEFFFVDDNIKLIREIPKEQDIWQVVKNNYIAENKKHDEKAPEIINALSELDEFVEQYETEITVADNGIENETVIFENEILAQSTSKPVSSDRKKPTVFGKVVDEMGDPIRGAKIIEKGTTVGTVTQVDGTFSLQVSDSSSKLIASFMGYDSKEIKPSDTENIIVLEPNNLALNEVVVAGIAKSDRKMVTRATESANKHYSADKETFGEKEFYVYCKNNAKKNICEEQSAVVKLSFFIDETGKPIEIEFKEFSCDDAKKEIEKLLSSSPVWTKTNRKVNITVKW